ncbi:hypothetical protein L7F22_046258 [Adiantum nelumboides]|nr:hypothetical protein [Adiantum nelumboides]
MGEMRSGQLLQLDPCQESFMTLVGEIAIATADPRGDHLLNLTWRWKVEVSSAVDLYMASASNSEEKEREREERPAARGFVRCRQLGARGIKGGGGGGGGDLGEESGVFIFSERIPVPYGE